MQERVKWDRYGLAACPYCKGGTLGKMLVYQWDTGNLYCSLGSSGCGRVWNADGSVMGGK